MNAQRTPKKTYLSLKTIFIVQCIALILCVTYSIFNKWQRQKLLDIMKTEITDMEMVVKYHELTAKNLKTLIGLELKTQTLILKSIEVNKSDNLSFEKKLGNIELFNKGLVKTTDNELSKSQNDLDELSSALINQSSQTLGKDSKLYKDFVKYTYNVKVLADRYKLYIESKNLESDNSRNIIRNISRQNELLIFKIDTLDGKVRYLQNELLKCPSKF